MIGIARQVLERAKLWHWRRDQATSEPLRQWYRQYQRVDVGLYSYGCFDHWRMPGPLIIGRYCSIAKTVRSAPINHPFDAITTHPALYERRFGVVDADIHYDDPQVIEDDVWIGHNAMILPSCRRIGRGSVIGAGAIVTKDVPRYSIVAGNPARLIRERFTPELQAALEASQWWTLDLAGLRTLVREQPDLVMNPTVERVSAWTAQKVAGQ
jgi:acetyltransferase-like isoleucine patch superfamily enzyme